jgi:hypothetical protein
VLLTLLNSRFQETDGKSWGGSVFFTIDVMPRLNTRRKPTATHLLLNHMSWSQIDVSANEGQYRKV